MQTRRYKSILAVFLTFFLMILAPTSYTAHAATMDVGTMDISTMDAGTMDAGTMDVGMMEVGSAGNVSGGNSISITETSQGIITAITDSDGLPIESSYSVTVPAGDSELLDELLWKLLRVCATVEGETETVALNVDWDYNSLTSNLDTPGEYTHTAAILADGYIFSDGVMQSLTIIVTVTEAVEKEPDIIWSFESLSNRYAYAVAAGSHWQEFWDTQFADYRWEQSWPCYTAEGEMLYAHIIWENPQPDMSRTGIVTVQGTAVLPENTMLAEGLTLPVVEVSVSIQSEPTLECWCADADVVYIPWVMGNPENEDSLRFLASVNGGEWVDASEWMDTNGESVCVWIYYLEEGSTYQVKAAWDGGETNVFEFTWSGAVTDAGPVEGDRDGGDTGGNPISDVHQPVPGSDPIPESDSTTKPDSTPKPDSALESNSKPQPTQEPKTVITVSNTELSGAEPKETFYEEVTDTDSLLSGTRLLMMRQSGAVRFSKQGITITLSDAALDTMGLTNDSRFLIRIERTRQGFILTAWLDGVPLTALPDTLVLFPFTPSADGSRISLLNEQDDNVCEGNYDWEMGIVSFTIQTTGQYTIMETLGQDGTPLTPKNTGSGQAFAETMDVAASQISAEKLEPEHFRSFLLITVISLAGLVAVWFLRRRWRR